MEHLKLSLVPVASVNHSFQQRVDVSMAHRMLLAVQCAHHIDTVDGWDGWWQAASGMLDSLVNVVHFLHNDSKIAKVGVVLVEVPRMSFESKK